MTPNLSPTLADLLAPRPDAAWLAALLLLGGWYALGFVHAPRAAWPAWRAALFGLGLLVALLVTQTAVTDFTLNSMTLYMARLMVLAEVVPPLVILGLPAGHLVPRGRAARALSWLLDPWVALALWTVIIVFWNVPAGFSASLVSNTASGLLPLLYVLGGLLSWAVVLRPLPTVQGRGFGNRGWFGLLASLPMMAVAAVWLYSPRVLYAPYVGALCLWNTTPLQNQVNSGWVMMIAGLPSMALAVAQLMLWLIALADSGTVTETEDPDAVNPDDRPAPGPADARP
ncbi:cytochrome c oxidase assembly protein [Deinococcus aquiradiocola]|uniref:Membrane protein n=1 Tax=Deinococcus aquiradiocola TaxID=393059 RepID=A0A917USA7_9DEIO|nr:cytochrome c oxidase assembly protein [Deinococcus aquiradiocola]GGJ81370.1 membrane protein [Deinococcus aquiradiocola]